MNEWELYYCNAFVFYAVKQDLVLLMKTTANFSSYN